MALEKEVEVGSITTAPVVVMLVVPAKEKLFALRFTSLAWLVPPIVFVPESDIASLPVPPPAVPVMVIGPEELLPTVEASIVTPSLLSDPLAPLFPVRLIAPPAEKILLPDVKTIPRKPTAVFTPPVPVTVIVPEPPVEIFEFVCIGTP
jgi:hypothetical protein